MHCACCHYRTVYWVQRESSVERVLYCKFDDCSAPQTLYHLKKGQTVQKLYFEVQEKSLFSVVSSNGSDHDTAAAYFNFQTGRDVDLHSGVVLQSVAAWGSHVYVLINSTNRSQYVCLVPQHGECVDPDLLTTDVVFHDITILSPISQRGRVPSPTP